MTALVCYEKDDWVLPQGPYILLPSYHFTQNKHIEVIYSEIQRRI